MRCVGAPTARVLGPMMIMWDSAPIPRRQIIKAFLVHGARPNGCAWSACWRTSPNCIRARACGNSSKRSSGAMCAASTSRICGMILREAVTQVRRALRVLHGFFRGAKLSTLMSGSVGINAYCRVQRTPANQGFLSLLVHKADRQGLLNTVFGCINSEAK
jgi:hypothetical protein